MAGRTRDAALLTMIALLAGCSGEKANEPLAAATKASSAIAAAVGAAVTIESSTFSPSPLEVASGTKVTVTNKDGITHTFTSVSGPASFDTGPLAVGASNDVTFSAAGTYAYQCSIHNTMKGSVLVS